MLDLLRQPRGGVHTEPFSSRLAHLQDTDGFDKLTCPKRAAAEFPQDPPGLELCIHAFTGTAEPGVSGVGHLLRGWLVSALYGTSTR